MRYPWTTIAPAVLQVSRTLLAYGADLNAEDKSGKKVSPSVNSSPYTPRHVMGIHLK